MSTRQRQAVSTAASPVLLYVFGKEGGPYKVGYSIDPSRRTKALRHIWPAPPSMARKA